MLMHVDRFEEAERCVYSVLKQPFDLGDMPPFARLALGAIRFHSGRWEHIERYLQLEPDPASSDYSDESWAVATALLTITFVHCDRIAEAGELIVRATRALATGSRPLLLWAALLVAEAAGRWDDMASLADRLIAALDFLQSPIRLRTSGPDLVRVLLRIDKRPRADAAAQALEELAAATDVASVAAAARLARGMVTMDPETLATAATLFEACGRPLEQATALEYLSLTLAASDRAAAIAVGRDAVAVYAQLGARRDERRVAAALRAIGAGTGRRGPRSRDVVGWGSLSPTERTVAELVARGMTNHEIGTSLQISPRTVESHIAHALNKLAVRNRAELAAIVGREGSSAPD
jgi:DNA-binding NarL/FixJ family response regulator